MKIASAALSGIRSAQIRFENSANRIVSAPFTPETSGEPAANPVNGVRETGIPSTAFIAAEDVYTQEAVNMTTAVFAYKASISAFETWNETTRETVAALSV